MESNNQVQTGPFGIQYQTGGWNVGGVNIPDFNISEAVLGTGYRGVPTNDPVTLNEPYNSYTPTQYTQAGDVNGISTNIPNPFPTSTGGGGVTPTGQTLQDLRGEIDKGYANVRSGIQDRLGDVGSFKDELLGNINTQAGALSGQVNTALSNTENRLGNLANTAKENKKLTFRELANDFQNALRAGNINLGTIGASSSSAVPMLNYALSKGTNQRSADLNRQLTDRLNQIDLAVEDARSQAQSQLFQVEQWSATESNKVAQYIEGIKQQLQNYEGKIDEAELANLEEEYVSAREYLNNVSLNSQAWQNQIAQSYAVVQDQARQATSEINAQGQNINPNMAVRNLGRFNIQDKQGIFNPGGFATSNTKDDNSFESSMGNRLNTLA